MLAFNERFRIAVLETVLRRNDREFVRRMELISGALLPPPRRAAPPPLDDAAPIRARTTVAPPVAKNRLRRGLSRLRRSWHQILAVLWAGVSLLFTIVGATDPETTAAEATIMSLFCWGVDGLLAWPAVRILRTTRRM